MAAAPPAPEEEDPDGPARRVPLPHDPAGGEGLGGAAGGRDPPGVPLARPRRHPDGRRAGEPALWRRIDMRGFACLPYWQRHRRDTVRAMAREAVRRSAGRCEEFWSKVGGDDEVLRFLADQ